VNPVYLFDLASRHVSWASFRQMVVTGNIANANTPGYQAQDVKPFTDVLDNVNLTMARTSSGHIDVDDAPDGATETTAADSRDVTYSGNSVSLDQELIKADDISRSVSLDVGVERAFHRMLMTSVGAGSASS